MTGFDGLAVLSLLLSIVSIGLRWWETPPEILRRVTVLELDLQEAIDTMSRWMKRENVRRARDAKEDSPPAGEQKLTIDAADKKAQLRAIARQKGLR